MPRGQTNDERIIDSLVETGSRIEAPRSWSLDRDLGTRIRICIQYPVAWNEEPGSSWRKPFFSLLNQIVLAVLWWCHDESQTDLDFDQAQ